MPAYQLEVAITLAFFVGCSIFAYWLAQPKEGQIKLPEYQDDSDIARDELEQEGKKDPFDVTNPEDFVDGYPLDEKGFYDKVRITKPTRRVDIEVGL